MKIKILFLNLVVAAMLAGAGFGVFYYVSKEKAANLTALTMQRVGVLAQSAAPLFENALAGTDGTLTDSAISAALKIGNVNSAFVLDGDGNVIAHSDGSVKGTVISGEVYTKAMQAQTNSLSQFYTPDEMLYSQRLSSRYVLFLVVPVKSDLALARAWEIKYGAVLSAAWLIIMFITYGLSMALFKPRVKQETEIPYEQENN